MKKTLKILPLMLGVLLFFTQCEKEAFDNSRVEAYLELKSGENCTVIQTLWVGAGQNNTNNGTNVGTVTANVVEKEGVDHLRVVYTTRGPWTLTETHLWVGSTKNGVPRNAAPGRFPFKADLDYERSWTQYVDLEKLGISPGNPIYVAAHAVVAEGDLEELEAWLPKEDVDFVWKFFTRVPNAVSYFEVTIDDEESWLEGIYEGWCADSEFPAGTNPRSGTVYSSYDDAFLHEDLDLRPYNFDSPLNLSLVNWVINNDFVGKESLAGGNFTLGDVQRAIWLLLSDNPELNPPGGVGPASAARVTEIINGAIVNGEDFRPGCGEYVVLVIVQDQSQKQPVLIKYPVPCGGSETAWAGGDGNYTFIQLRIANKWGWVFEIGCY